MCPHLPVELKPPIPLAVSWFKLFTTIMFRKNFFCKQAELYVVLYVSIILYIYLCTCNKARKKVNLYNQAENITNLLAQTVKILMKLVNFCVG